MSKSTHKYLTRGREGLRSLRHGMQRGRYTVRTKPYLAMAVAASVGLLIGLLLNNGPKSPNNR